MEGKVDKSQKYDRQLRQESLWQAHGQHALETARVCLLNGTATGTEILKNLVLPGIGSFTLVDGKTVDGSDVGCNFFLEQSSIGKKRAKCAAELLGELNEEVAAHHSDEDPISIIESRPEFFKQFSIVISCNLPEGPLMKLADICWQYNVPLVVARTYGFVGYLRIVIPEHTVVETHPEQLIDLRLDCPFEELLHFSQSINLNALDSMQFAHVPFPVILLQCLEEWKKTHNGQSPQNYKEKTQFKDLINSKRRSASDDAENFDEAIAFVHRACSPTVSANFWVLVRALRDFVQNEGKGKLPVVGTVPDMKSDTETYVQLQTLFRAKAREDANHIRSRVQAILSTIDKAPDSIPQEEIDRFCKNASLTQVIRYRSLKDEYNMTGSLAHDLGRFLDDLDSHAIFYVLLRAVDRFQQSQRKLPGAYLEDLDMDIGHLKKNVVALLSKWQLNATTVSDDYIHEIVRCGGAELPTMAGIMGGIVSQEVIKILTHQYIPLNNTLIYDGIRSTSWTHKF
ncbi:NEDD8-activating enzyme E1 regulatory subunit [Dinochytrium kinnereticum]|nr:NEDD8-activating enzyme E1 regulatory subunit [Dinochytrium kinnereticum]